MKVYVFGNEDLKEDSRAYQIAQKLEGKIPSIEFMIVNQNEDLPFAEEEKVVVMDVVLGLKQVRLLGKDIVNKLLLSPKNSVHDFDLAFQLNYLQKLGKLGKVVIIGLPPVGPVDHKIVQSILRKLVAQDIQGS